MVATDKTESVHGITTGAIVVVKTGMETGVTNGDEAARCRAREIPTRYHQVATFLITMIEMLAMLAVDGAAVIALDAVVDRAPQTRTNGSTTFLINWTKNHRHRIVGVPRSLRTLVVTAALLQGTEMETTVDLIGNATTLADPLAVEIEMEIETIMHQLPFGFVEDIDPAAALTIRCRLGVPLVHPTANWIATGVVIGTEIGTVGATTVVGTTGGNKVATCAIATVAVADATEAVTSVTAVDTTMAIAVTGTGTRITMKADPSARAII